MFTTKKSILFIPLLLCASALFCADLPPRPLSPVQKIELNLLEKWVQEKVRNEQYAELGYRPSELEITMRKWYENRYPFHQ